MSETLMVYDSTLVVRGGRAMGENERMAVGDIIEDWLKSHGYGGLVNGYIRCGCKIGDLYPGGSDCLDINECYPGYEWPCDPENCINPDCDGRENPEMTEWCIRREKPGTACGTGEEE